MTRTISTTDIAALQAVRSVIADATGHPGQQAAIEVIDRLGRADPVPGAVTIRDVVTILDATQPYPDAAPVPTSVLDSLTFEFAHREDGHPTREECMRKFDEVRAAGAFGGPAACSSSTIRTRPSRSTHRPRPSRHGARQPE